MVAGIEAPVSSVMPACLPLDVELRHLTGDQCPSHPQEIAGAAIPPLRVREHYPAALLSGNDTNMNGRLNSGAHPLQVFALLWTLGANNSCFRNESKSSIPELECPSSIHDLDQACRTGGETRALEAGRDFRRSLGQR